METGKLSFLQKNWSVRLGKTEREFDFGDESLDYRVSDRTGEKTLSISYGQINTKNSKVLTVKDSAQRTRLITVYALLILLVCRISGQPSSSPFVVTTLLFSIIPLAAFYVFTRKQRKYTIFNSSSGEIWILHNEQYDEILEQLKSRQRAFLKKKLAVISVSSPPDKEMAKFEILFKEGIINEQEYLDAKNKLQKMMADRNEPPLPGEKPLN